MRKRSRKATDDSHAELAELAELAEPASTEHTESEAEFTDGDTDDTDETTATRSKPTSRNTPPVKRPRSRFLDMEAEVGDDDEEDDEEDDYDYDDDDEEEDEDYDDTRAHAHNRAHDPYPTRLPHPPTNDAHVDAEAETRRLRALYGRVRTGKTPSSTTLTPRPFLLPTVTDPKLWLCRVQQGKERSASLALLRVVMERQFRATGTPPAVYSVLARDGLRGYVYIEAHKPALVAQAIATAKLNHCMFPGPDGRGLVLVPMGEMAQVLQTTAAQPETQSVAIGAWVRVKRGRYANDLARVIDNLHDEGVHDPATSLLRIQLLPRLPFNTTPPAGDRPPPRAFDPEEAARHGPVSKSRGFWLYGGETFRDGLLHKTLRLSSLLVDAVPTAEELARFPDAQAAQAAQTDTLPSPAADTPQVGDRVVVLEGEMKNLRGVVDALETRPNPATGRPELLAHIIADPEAGLEGDAARLTLRTALLRRTFTPGDHVRVTVGPHAGITGIVVQETGVSLVIFSSVVGGQFSVSPGAVVRADRAETVAGGESLPAAADARSQSLTQQNALALDDLVQFDAGVGIVVRIDEGTVVVFDSLGQVRSVPRAKATLLAGAPTSGPPPVFGSDEPRPGDRVLDATGSPCKLLHVYKSLAFVRPLRSPTPASVAVLPLANLQRPGAPAARTAGPFVGRGLIGRSVTIAFGPHKGYVGFVKQLHDGVARVELHTNGKVVSVPADRLVIPGRDQDRERSVPPPVWNAASASRTPAWNAPVNATPAWTLPSSSKTPAWNAPGNATPGIHVASGSKTPAWSAIAGGITPAWNVPMAVSQSAAWNSTKTPVWQQSAKTPAWQQSAKTPAWQQSAPPKKDDAESDSGWSQIKEWRREGDRE